MSALGILSIVQIITELMATGARAVAGWKEVNALVATMVAENRDATRAEIAIVRAAIAVNTTAIEDANAARGD